MRRFTADFETCTWLEDETYVWAWAICEIGNDYEIKIDNNIDSFMKFCEEEKNPIIYFHNLRFDGEFIIYWLFKNGFKHVKKQEDVETKSFLTLINEQGMFYSITVYFKKKNKKVQKVTFIDSLKILPFKVETIAKSFNLEESKLKIDYNAERKRGHKLTKEEEDYIKNDVIIVAKALKVLFDEKLEKMTQGSNAVFDFKNTMTKSRYEHLFSEITKMQDEDIRKSYKGGFTYLNPLYKEKDVENVTILDVNSLYPSVMRYCKFPFGEPIFYEGKYEEDKVYDLYIQMITCSFELKNNKIPTIQIKKSTSFRQNEYLESSNNQIVALCLTCVDLKLFLEQYNVYDLEYVSGYKFKSVNGIFDKYIDKWIERKNQATIEGNKGIRTLCKLMLNSLYGKLSTSMVAISKSPYLLDDVVHYNTDDEEEKKGFYIPCGSFITAYAREKTIRTSQAIKDYSIEKYGIDKYIYSDTDSIHTTLDINELKKFCDIDDVKLGAWKFEGFATRARFLRQKCYIEEIEGKINITCAGMPTTCYDYVNWNNFKIGLTCGGKLRPKHVKRWCKIS